MGIESIGSGVPPIAPIEGANLGTSTKDNAEKRRRAQDRRNTRFIKSLELVSAEVATWPDWKKNSLGIRLSSAIEGSAETDTVEISDAAREAREAYQEDQDPEAE